VAIVKDGLTRLDGLDQTLGAPTVDQMAAQAAAKEFGGNTCGGVPQALSRRRRPVGISLQARRAVAANAARRCEAAVSRRLTAPQPDGRRSRGGRGPLCNLNALNPW